MGIHTAAASAARRLTPSTAALLLAQLATIQRNTAHASSVAIRVHLQALTLRVCDRVAQLRTAEQLGEHARMMFEAFCRYAWADLTAACDAMTHAIGVELGQSGGRLIPTATSSSAQPFDGV